MVPLARATMECGRTVLVSPITPSTPAAMVLGTCTAAECAKYLGQLRTLEVLSVVRNAAGTGWLDPVARTRNGGAVAPASRPREGRCWATAGLVAAAGGNRALNCPWASQCW